MNSSYRFLVLGCLENGNFQFFRAKLLYTECVRLFGDKAIDNLDVTNNVA